MKTIKELEQELANHQIYIDYLINYFSNKYEDDDGYYFYDEFINNKDIIDFAKYNYEGRQGTGDFKKLL